MEPIAGTPMQCLRTAAGCRFAHVFIIFSFTAKSQLDIKAYLAPIDYPGLSIEYAFMPKNSIEAGGSCHYNAHQVFWLDADREMRTTHYFVHLMYKHYKNEDHRGFFSGGYARYWSKNVGNALPVLLNAQQQLFVDTNLVTYRTARQKLSVGYLIGWKKGKTFTVGVNLGIGYSIFFRETQFHIGKPSETWDVSDIDLLGKVSGISLLGQLALGWHLGMVPVKKMPQE